MKNSNKDFKNQATTLSIVIPTFNESKSGYLPKILKSYDSLPDCEILCVDGGSTDNTLDIIKSSSAKLIKTNIPSRAGRLNEGIRQATAEMILLHHPRSILSPSTVDYLNKNRKTFGWGAFTHQFDDKHPLLSFTSWYSNKIRGDKSHIFYLDHCLFAQKKMLFKVGMFPEIDIFEDTEICLRLKKISKPTRLPFTSTTSAIRFKTHGYFKQAVKNQILKWGYYFKVPHQKMNKFYEKKVVLNTEYHSDHHE